MELSFKSLLRLKFHNARPDVHASEALHPDSGFSPVEKIHKENKEKTNTTTQSTQNCVGTDDTTSTVSTTHFSEAHIRRSSDLFSQFSIFLRTSAIVVAVEYVRIRASVRDDERCGLAKCWRDMNFEHCVARAADSAASQPASHSTRSMTGSSASEGFPEWSARGQTFAENSWALNATTHSKYRRSGSQLRKVVAQYAPRHLSKFNHLMTGSNLEFKTSSTITSFHQISIWLKLSQKWGNEKNQTFLSKISRERSLRKKIWRDSDDFTISDVIHYLQMGPEKERGFLSDNNPAFFWSFIYIIPQKIWFCALTSWNKICVLTSFLRNLKTESHLTNRP